MFRENDHISAEGTEFRGEAPLGVDLKIEEGGSDGGAGAQGEQHNKEAAAIGAQETADDAPEHGAIGGTEGGHHSPLRMGAGS